MSIERSSHHRRPRGSSLVELIIVTVLFIVTIPAALGVFVGARKINGQAYLQHRAALTLGETNDILRFMRDLDFDSLQSGQFYLIRNPGSSSWLIKSDVPSPDAFERKVIISDALRHTDTGDLYMPGDSGASVADLNTKKIVINVLWAPDYLPLDILTQTFYITHWDNNTIIY